MKKRTIGIIAVVAAMIFANGETLYFGNNLFPCCWQEWACDSISIIAFVTGITLIFSPHNQ